MKQTMFIGWPGGKRRFINRILELPPDTINSYHEPFLGGGATWYQLHDHRDIRRSYLADTNHMLIDAWRVLQKHPHRLMEALDPYYEHNCYSYFYHIRDVHNELDFVDHLDLEHRIQRAARFLYMVKGGFNNSYSLNRYGKCGSRPSLRVTGKRPLALYERGSLLETHRRLQTATLLCDDFTVVEPVAGDFVYLDPPYYERTFEYGFGGFTLADQHRLYEQACLWRDAGAHVVASNSNNIYVRELWRGWHVTEFVKGWTTSPGHKHKKSKTELMFSSREI